MYVDFGGEKSNKEYEEEIPKLTDEQCKDVEGIITKEEVLFTLRRMKNGTSPGSDGFSVDFYLKKIWNDLDSFRVRSINELSEKKSYLCLKRKGYLHCYQKETNLAVLRNWRPITLHNVACKISSGCTANIMKRVLPDQIC